MVQACEGAGPSTTIGDHLKTKNLHNILGGHSHVIDAIKPSLVERSAVVDIEIAFGASPEDRESVITSMFMAGYKLRNDELNTLTFLKEFE